MPEQSKPINILIIGGSGFVSGTLARTALAQGHHVWCVTRGMQPLPDGVHGLVADRNDHVTFSEAVEGAGKEWDLVVDCIGYDPADARQDLATFRQRARHLVFISTDFVFDPARRQFPQSEVSEHYLPGDYGGKKRFCELELLNGDAGEMAWTVIRPGHIYGPGSLLGCLPAHGRDGKLIEKLKVAKPLQLVGGGYFLQQPILASDLATLILSCWGNMKSHHEIFCCGGPDIIESHAYYRIIAEVLGVGLEIEELPVARYLAENPQATPFLCHRFYDLGKMRAAGLAVPSTPIEEGLRQHVRAVEHTQSC